MRTNLYRGKMVDGCHVWVEGSLSTHTEPGAVGIIYPITVEDEDFNSHQSFDYAEVIPETVGQFIGCDRFNKLIFEGDIVKYEVVFENGSYPHYETKIAVVEFTHGIFKPFDKCLPFNCIKLGNIHDNPELISE